MAVRSFGFVSFQVGSMLEPRVGLELLIRWSWPEAEIKGSLVHRLSHPAPQPDSFLFAMTRSPGREPVVRSGSFPGTKQRVPVMLMEC